MHLFSGRSDKSGDRELELKRVIMSDDASEEVIQEKGIILNFIISFRMERSGTS